MQLQHVCVVGEKCTLATDAASSTNSKGGVTFWKVCHICNRAVLNNMLLVSAASPEYPEVVRMSVPLNATAWARSTAIVKAAAAQQQQSAEIQSHCRGTGQESCRQH